MHFSSKLEIHFISGIVLTEYKKEKDDEVIVD